MRAHVNQDVCIGAAPCVAIASKTFALNAEGKAYVKQQGGDTDELLWQAAESCPVQAVILFDDDGKQLYP